MSIKVEQFHDFESGDQDRRFLFFGDTLHIGLDTKEDHASILKGSGRLLSEILVAGGSYFEPDNLLMLNSRGSRGLGIGSRDPSPVVEFIKSFPDSVGKIILTP